MSWDADLYTACCGSHRGEWNYTYNTTPMVRAAATRIGIPFDSFQATLHGMTGHESVPLLRAVIEELEQNADRYEVMNPSNGWGSRVGIIEVMREMADAADIATPTVWRMS